MVVTFLALSAKRPIGGVTSVYEFANGLSRRGHEVHLVHVDFLGGSREPAFRIPDPIEAVEDITWVGFDEQIRHHIARPFEEAALPSSDFIFYYGGSLPKQSGLPLIFIQAYMILPQDYDRSLYREPCPKICIARWLVDVAVRFGVPEHQLIHVPYGLDHDKYRLMAPIEDRPPQVAMCYSSHYTKGPKHGLEALAEAKRRFPELRAVLFGAMDSFEPTAAWMTYHLSPDQDVIVKDVYNRSRIFMNSSVLEGFGLPCIEAMACGSCLVTTDNGGSRDYAMHGETALVSEPADVGAMVDNIEKLLTDDGYRIQLAAQGKEYVKRFDWDASARDLEAFLERYGADPERYRRPASDPA
jgi:glycosyltransferase involved in cell wall biosynthesis